MTIHFAAARSTEVSAIAKTLSASITLDAANDNMMGIGGNKVLQAALKHFVEHGLSAAEVAKDRAEEAFFAGRRQDYRRWMSICHTLDRRMAKSVAFHTAKR